MNPAESYSRSIECRSNLTWKKFSMPSLIDTHAHLYEERFGDNLENVLERSREAGVAKVVVPATSPSEFRSVLDLARRYDVVEAVCGIHPHHAGEITQADIDEVERIAGSGATVAVGEIGLDYFHTFAPPQVQQELFRQQLRIAKRHSLPAVVHNRNSDEDLLRILQEEQDGSLRFQLHCFSSDEIVLERALSLGA